MCGFVANMVSVFVAKFGVIAVSVIKQKKSASIGALFFLLLELSIIELV